MTIINFDHPQKKSSLPTPSGPGALAKNTPYMTEPDTKRPGQFVCIWQSESVSVTGIVLGGPNMMMHDQQSVRSVSTVFSLDRI